MGVPMNIDEEKNWGKGIGIGVIFLLCMLFLLLFLLVNNQREQKQDFGPYGTYQGQTAGTANTPILPADTPRATPLYDAIGDGSIWFDNEVEAKRACPHEDVRSEYGPRNSTRWRCHRPG